MTEAVALEDFHLETLFSLSLGDMVELPSLMGGLSPSESVMAMVSEVTEKEVTLRLTWQGVWLATRTLRATKDGPVWEN